MGSVSVGLVAFKPLASVESEMENVISFVSSFKFYQVPTRDSCGIYFLSAMLQVRASYCEIYEQNREASILTEPYT